MARSKRTLFLDNRNRWIMSEPTDSGFLHTRLGTTNTFQTRELAEKEMVRVVRRRQRAAVKQRKSA
jgi:hypothetical protein